MSKSFKHTPIIKGGSRISKQQANKKIRQKLKNIDYDIGNYTYYKFMTESWDICDYKTYCPAYKIRK